MYKPKSQTKTEISQILGAWYIYNRHNVKKYRKSRKITQMIVHEPVTRLF